MIRVRNSAVPAALLVMCFTGVCSVLSDSVAAQDVKTAPVAESRSDGWTTTNAETVGLSASKLLEMEGTIRADQFKKITSVVIARHEKLTKATLAGLTRTR